MFGYKLVPAKNGAPEDLPAWAKDELVHRRVAMLDLESENMRLTLELAKARGEDVTSVMSKTFNERILPKPKRRRPGVSDVPPQLPPLKGHGRDKKELGE